MRISRVWPAERLRRLEDLQERAARHGFKVESKDVGRQHAPLFAFIVTSTANGVTIATIFGLDNLATFLANHEERT